jgi:hypothetical protein
MKLCLKKADGRTIIAGRDIFSKKNKAKDEKLGLGEGNWEKRR